MRKYIDIIAEANEMIEEKAPPEGWFKYHFYCNEEQADWIAHTMSTIHRGPARELTFGRGTIFSVSTTPEVMDRLRKVIGGSVTEVDVAKKKG